MAIGSPASAYVPAAAVDNGAFLPLLPPEARGGIRREVLGDALKLLFDKLIIILPRNHFAPFNRVTYSWYADA